MFPVSPTAFVQGSQTSIARSSGYAIGAIPTAFALSSFGFSGVRRSRPPQDSSWMGKMVQFRFLSFLGRLEATGYRLEVRRQMRRTRRRWPAASNPSSGSTRAIGILGFDVAGILRPLLTE